jgi:hypothetical protein
MVKTINFILTFCFLILLKSNCFSQPLQIGISSGFIHIQNPELFTKSISKDGLGFEWGTQFGIRLKYAFKDLPLKLTGRFDLNKLNGKGNARLIAPPWS